MGQHGSTQCAGSIVRGPLISAMNDADHEEFVQLHVASKNLQSIQGKERFEDFMVELDTFEFDLLLLSETWRGEKRTFYNNWRSQSVFERWFSWQTWCGHLCCKKIVGQNEWCSLFLLFGPGVHASFQI